ncbi:MAG: lysophospholipid acyltransferase family protein [Ferruginibacter sp.]
MSFITRLFRLVFSIYGFIVFLALMFLLFPLVVIASFFGAIRGGNTIYNICRFWADVAMFCWGIRHRNIHKAPKVTDHAAVFVFNHVSYMDIPVILKTFRRQPVRILGKAEMAKIPIFGFIYSKAVVMVYRADATARANSLRRLKAVLRKNISIIVAPEGTFNMTNKPLKEFYNGAFNAAIETQTPIQPVIFLDAYDRMPYETIFSLNPGRSRSVFLEEIKVDGYTMEDVQELKSLVYQKMEEALINYNASWIRN